MIVPSSPGGFSNQHIPGQSQCEKVTLYLWPCEWGEDITAAEYFCLWSPPEILEALCDLTIQNKVELAFKEELC